ncbi:unnamed protein product [Zymoseptoria tritici ST99CH_1A5]|uniref:Uncharacterized protein n=2 Tax=Zymoseptoria tritici TaxID=1047171 RepID=A0A2H1H9D8_ZYMTR|nr:unnamed protein product [Zymoseptoria tritici ST99CH_1E4]SMY30248.1 unnamed protein product [Zymoseptoria tritici ST99CH_1A5]
MAFITEISVTELSGSTRDPGVTSFSIDVPNRTISSYSHILLDVSFPTGVFVQPILDFAIKSIDGLGLLSKRSVAKFRSQIIRPFLPPEDHPLLPLLLRTSNTGDLVQPSLDFAIKAIDGADLLYGVLRPMMVLDSKRWKPALATLPNNFSEAGHERQSLALLAVLMEHCRILG